MARYREKDAADLAFNAIRRRITRELDTEIANWRERALNELLPAAWRAFEEATDDGELIEIESHVANWVGDALSKALGQKMQALEVALESDTSPSESS